MQAVQHQRHPESKTAGICTEHYSLHAAGFIPQGKIAVAAACVLYKVCNLAAQGNVKQSVVCIQQHFNVVVQGRNGNYFSHNPASRAARIETPMALSLEYIPGTKYTCGSRFCTHAWMISLLITPPAQTTGHTPAFCLRPADHCTGFPARKGCTAFPLHWTSAGSLPRTAQPDGKLQHPPGTQSPV